LCPEYETLGSLETEVEVDSWMGVRGRRRAAGAANSLAEDSPIGELGYAPIRGSVTTWEGSLAGWLLLFVLFCGATLPLAGREKNKLSYGEGLIVNVSLPVSEVEQVVEDVAQNGVIRGTKEYNKDEFVSGAKLATSSHVFPAWTEGGKVFYKVREQALDPRNFKDSSDSGTLVVRYVVQAQGQKNTVLRINALFKEDYRHIVHQSDGSVETAEYNDIREHVEAIQLMKKQNIEADQQRQERLAKKQSIAKQADGGAWPMPQSEPPQSSSKPVVEAAESQEDAAPASAATQSSGLGQSSGQALSNQTLSNQSSPSQSLPNQSSPSAALSSQSVPVQKLSGPSLEARVKDLRKQVERLVKAPGAPLKTAPFHTASTLQSLPTGTEVLILISTPYWYGIETHEGQHGWIMRDELEQP
jgi:hypothetical protein